LRGKLYFLFFPSTRARRGFQPCKVLQPVLVVVTAYDGEVGQPDCSLGFQEYRP